MLQDTTLDFSEKNNLWKDTILAGRSLRVSLVTATRIWAPIHTELRTEPVYNWEEPVFSKAAGKTCVRSLVGRLLKYSWSETSAGANLICGSRQSALNLNLQDLLLICSSYTLSVEKEERKKLPRNILFWLSGDITFLIKGSCYNKRHLTCLRC